MSQRTRRACAVFILLALALTAALVGCTTSPNGVTQKATATTSPRATSTSQPGKTPSATATPAAGGTPSPTATPATACEGKLGDIPLPDRSQQVGSTKITGATTSCTYLVGQDVQTVDTFFKTQMGKAGWTLLHDSPEGPLGFAQVYFKKQRFATITLSQHQLDTHRTDVIISVEASQ